MHKHRRLSASVIGQCPPHPHAPSGSTPVMGSGQACRLLRTIKKNNLIESQSESGSETGEIPQISNTRRALESKIKAGKQKSEFPRAHPGRPYQSRSSKTGVWGGNADNVLIPHYVQGPSRGQNGLWAINAHRERIEASSKRLVVVVCVYDRNQMNQSRNTLPGTLSSTFPGIRSTVLGGAFDIPARSLVVALHTFLSIDAVQ